MCYNSYCFKMLICTGNLELILPVECPVREIYAMNDKPAGDVSTYSTGLKFSVLDCGVC